MFEFSDNGLINLLNDDAPYLDNTSFGLGICGKANLCFFQKTMKSYFAVSMNA